MTFWEPAYLQSLKKRCGSQMRHGLQFFPLLHTPTGELLSESVGIMLVYVILKEIVRRRTELADHTRYVGPSINIRLLLIGSKCFAYH